MSLLGLVGRGIQDVYLDINAQVSYYRIRHNGEYRCAYTNENEKYLSICKLCLNGSTEEKVNVTKCFVCDFHVCDICLSYINKCPNCNHL
jgi:hypothetical protein